MRRAVAVAVATVADARTVATYSGMTGPLDALRGGTYVVSEKRVRFVGARVVSDARADGTFDVGAASQGCGCAGTACRART